MILLWWGPDRVGPDLEVTVSGERPGDRRSATAAGQPYKKNHAKPGYSEFLKIIENQEEQRKAKKNLETPRKTKKNQEKPRKIKKTKKNQEKPRKTKKN